MSLEFNFDFSNSKMSIRKQEKKKFKIKNDYLIYKGLERHQINYTQMIKFQKLKSSRLN